MAQRKIPILPYGIWIWFNKLDLKMCFVVFKSMGNLWVVSFWMRSVDAFRVCFFVAMSETVPSTNASMSIYWTLPCKMFSGESDSNGLRSMDWLWSRRPKIEVGRFGRCHQDSIICLRYDIISQFSHIISYHTVYNHPISLQYSFEHVWSQCCSKCPFLTPSISSLKAGGKQSASVKQIKLS